MIGSATGQDAQRSWSLRAHRRIGERRRLAAIAGWPRLSRLAPGQHVITVHPAYQSLYDLARWIGCEVSAWRIQLKSDGTGWWFDLDELAALIRPETRLLVLNFPHNPTGYLPDRATLDKIMTVAPYRARWSSRAGLVPRHVPVPSPKIDPKARALYDDSAAMAAGGRHQPPAGVARPA